MPWRRGCVRLNPAAHGGELTGMPVFTGGELNGWMIVGFVLPPAPSSGTTPCRPWAPTSPPTTRQRRRGGRCCSSACSPPRCCCWAGFSTTVTQPGGVWWCPVDRFPCRTLHLGLRSASCGGAAVDPVGAPLSTSFLVLCSFQPARSAPCWRRRWSATASPSVWGFWFMAWVCGCWNAGCVSDQSLGMRRSESGGSAVVFHRLSVEQLVGAGSGQYFCVRAAPSRWPDHGDLHAGDLPRPLPARGRGGGPVHRFSSPRATPLICAQPR